MASQGAQRIELPTDADESQLRAQRAVVEGFLEGDNWREPYQTAPGKLSILAAILDANVIRPDQTYALQCLGVVLGDALAQGLGMDWVMVEDEYGLDPALRLPGTSIILFPLTMISKRVELGEKVDVRELFVVSEMQVSKARNAGG